MTVDWTDDNPHAHMALAQYSQGIPLQRKPNAIASGNNTILGGSNSLIASGAVLDQLAYHLIIGVAQQNAGATIPFARLLFNWADSASGLAIQPDEAVLCCGSSGLNFYYISGPARADSVTLQLNNLDPAQPITYSFGMSEQGHVYEYFSVEEVTQLPVIGFTRSGQKNTLSTVGSVGALLAASGTIDRLAATWGGEANVHVDNTAGTVPIEVLVLDPGVTAGGVPLLGVANSGIIWGAQVPASSTADALIHLPYGSVIIRETNLSNVTAVQPTTTIMRGRI